jgi:hypothetical protein
MIVFSSHSLLAAKVARCTLQRAIERSKDDHVSTLEQGTERKA